MNNIKSTNLKPRPEPRWKKILVWVLTIFAATAFIAAGSSKLIGSEKTVSLFVEIGFGQWFRYLTGLVEVIGGILILLPRTSFWGALLLSQTMIGAILVHLFVIGGNSSIAFILLLITSILTLVKPIKN